MTGKNSKNYDFVIVGAGIVGLSIARELSRKNPGVKIAVIEKEPQIALHSSGRNSGVLHAGFYYTADSLKARFTVEGNRMLTEYCLENSIPINRCGKVVVARDEAELKTLHELEKRGIANGASVKLIDEKELAEIEPNARTYLKALYSSTTSSVDPKTVCGHIAKNLGKNVELLLNTAFVRMGEGSIVTNRGSIGCVHMVNAAGLYADRIAHRCGVGSRYAMIPFKGVYLKYGDANAVRTHIYPVPNLKNPFLGVHYTKMADGAVKIGPTSMPAFWRENYTCATNFKLSELFEMLSFESRMFLRKPAFRSLAVDEVRKYRRRHLIGQSLYMVKKIDVKGFGSYLNPGIRAQLVDRKSLDLVMDFVIEKGERSTHVLNAVSPAFTCAFSFARHVVAGMVLQ